MWTHKRCWRGNSWRDLWIPFRRNRWFQLAWIIMLVGIATICAALPSWHPTMSRTVAHHFTVHVVLGWGIFSIGFVLFGGAEFGVATVKSYRTTLRRYHENMSAETNPQPNTWDQKRYARTYCAQVGVKAAAIELGHGRDVPGRYAVWWQIAQRCTD